jgi:hypothetical protein
MFEMKCQLMVVEINFFSGLHNKTNLVLTLRFVGITSV